MARRTTMRTRLALAGAAPLALILASCAPGGTEDPEEPADGGATEEAVSVEDMTKEDVEGKSIDYLYFTDGPDQAATEELISAFEEEYGVTVNLEIVPYADLETTLQARLSGGEAPDVARLTATAPFYGDLLDLTPYVGEDYPDTFIEGLRPAMEHEEEIIAVPSDLTMNGFFVNVEQFEEAGVDLPDPAEPWTWEEMMEAATTVQDAAGTEFAFAMDKSGHRLSTVLSQNGTYLVDAEGGVLDPALATEALQPLTTMIEEGTSPRDFWLDSGTKYAGANEVFLAQQAPVYLSGNWQVAQFDSNAQFEWSAAPNPCLAECGGFPGGKFMAGFADTDEPALTALFIHHMNDAEQQGQFVDASNFLPTRVDLVEEGVDYGKRPEDMAVFLEDITRTPPAAYASAYSPEFAAAANEFLEAYAEVVAGQAELSEAMEDLSSTLGG